MTTYILNDNYEELINRDLTKKILHIMKNSEKKQLTKKVIFSIGNQRYKNNFTSDSNTIIRYLKTMAKYGLVIEKNQGFGKATLWELKKLDSDLNFHVNINEHINKLKEISDRQTPETPESPCITSRWLLSHKKNSVVNVYGFPVLDIINFGDKNFRDKYDHELDEIINQFHDATKKLYKFKNKTFNLIYGVQYNKTKSLCKSEIDHMILFLYDIGSRLSFTEYFDFEKISDDKYLLCPVIFEKNKYPYVLKPSLDLLNSFDELTNHLKNSYKNISREELWEKLDGYQLSKDFSDNLCILANIVFVFEIQSNVFFTVICERSLPDKVYKGMVADHIDFLKFLAKKFQDKRKELQDKRKEFERIIAKNKKIRKKNP